MADETIGWKIDGRFYPHVFPDALRHGDFALIREITGMTMDQFDRADDAQAFETGWIAIAVWHANPEFRRDQVVQAVERLPVSGAGAPVRVGWEMPLEVADDVPPTADGSPTSEDSSIPSSDSPEAKTTPNAERSSEESSPESFPADRSGTLESVIGAPA